MREVLFPNTFFTTAMTSLLGMTCSSVKKYESAAADSVASSVSNPNVRKLKAAADWKSGKTGKGTIKILMEGLAGVSVASYYKLLTDDEGMAVTKNVLSLGN